MNEKSRKLQAVYDCIPCNIGALVKLINDGIVPPDKQDLTMRNVLEYYAKVDLHRCPVLYGKESHEIIRKSIGNPDPYKEIKREFNQLLLHYYDELKAEVEVAENPFQLALRLAIAGNIIDFGMAHSFNINEIISKAKNVNLAVDDSVQLHNEIRTAKTILYLGDNAGEIVMDRLFIETIDHPNIYFAVRESPIINDVTREDAEFVQMDKIAAIISNGDNAPGTILDNVSEQFLEIFHKADLIISKGQGNYEGLCGSDKNIFFLLMAKCQHVAKMLNVRVRDFLAKKLN